MNPTHAAAGAADLPPEVVAGRYRPRARLAQGGVGVVYAADDQSTGRSVALKQLLPQAARDRRLVMLFQREYHTLAQLRHPRVIEVLDYGVDAGGPFYTMELLDGSDLGELAPIPYRRACHYLRDVASCLSLLHTRRLLHRDLSPRNVRCTSDDRCKLLDFGTMATFGVASEIVGTPPLVAPECLRGVPLDHRADLYSLGALAYRLLTRRYAYHARKIEQLPGLWRTPPAPPSSLVPDIPRELDELVLSLLNLDPVMRPTTAAEVIDRLTSLGDLEQDIEVGEAARSYLISAKLVGRERVVNLLRRRIGRAMRGRGSTILIEGEAGTGKSRLLDEATLLGLVAGALTVRVDSRAHRAPNTVAADLVRGIFKAAPTEAAEAQGDDGDTLLQMLEAVTDRPSSESFAPLPPEAPFQNTVLGFLGRMALRVPLVLLIDDIDLADGSSSALLAALAHEAAHRPMLIVATRQAHTKDKPQSHAGDHSLTVLAGLATGVRARNLRRSQTAEMLRGAFGDVPNVDELAHCLYAVARGNPTQTMSMCQHLVERGVIRYVAGVWVLPATVPADELPGDFAETVLAQVQPLPAEAQRMARTLSVRRGPISLGLCVALARDDHEEQVFKLLDDLLGGGVLVNAGEDYVFASEALRRALQTAMSEEDRKLSHQRMGNALLSQQPLNPSETIEAALHLQRGDEAARGAELVALAAPLLAPRGMHIEAAVPALEAALATFEAQARRPTLLLRLRTALVMSSVREVCERQAEQTLAQLGYHAGLPVARRLRPLLGPRLALLIGAAVSSLRRAVSPGERRGPPPTVATAALMRCLYSLLPLSASTGDRDGLRTLLDVAGVLVAVPGMGQITHRLMAAGVASLQGEHTRAIDQLLPAIDALHRDGQVRNLSQEAQRGILAGAYILLALSHVQASVQSRAALEAIGALENLGRDPRFKHPDTGIGPEGGLTAAEIMRAAHQLRVAFHVLRGELEAATVQAARFPLVGGQRGMYWRFDIRQTLCEVFAAAVALDLVALRRATEQLKQLSARGDGDAALLRDALVTGLAAMSLARGQASECLARLDAEADQPGLRFAGWEARALLRVLCLRELSQSQRACEVAHDAIAELAQRGARGQYGTLLLRCALATDQAISGYIEDARRTLNDVAEWLADADHPVLLKAFHEASAVVTHAEGDDASTQQSIDDATRWATHTHNPAVIARTRRWAQRLQGERGVEQAEQTVGSEQAQVCAIKEDVARVMDGAGTADQRARRALHMLLERATAVAGHLFELQPDGELILAASADEGAPPEALESHLRTLLEGPPPGTQGDGRDPLAAASVTRVQLAGEPDATPLAWNLLLLRGPAPDHEVIGAVALSAEPTSAPGVVNAYLEAVANVLRADRRTRVDS